MTADTTPTPNDLLTRIAAASAAGKVEELRDLVGLLPSPPRPRLRVVSLDQPMDWMTHNGGYVNVPQTVSSIEALPDPMAVIDEQLTEWWTESDTGIDALRRRLRAALEGATQ